MSARNLFKLSPNVHGKAGTDNQRPSQRAKQSGLERAIAAGRRLRLILGELPAEPFVMPPQLPAGWGTVSGDVDLDSDLVGKLQQMSLGGIAEEDEEEHQDEGSSLMDEYIGIDVSGRRGLGTPVYTAQMPGHEMPRMPALQGLSPDTKVKSGKAIPSIPEPQNLRVNPAARPVFETASALPLRSPYESTFDPAVLAGHGNAGASSSSASNPFAATCEDESGSEFGPPVTGPIYSGYQRMEGAESSDTLVQSQGISIGDFIEDFNSSTEQPSSFMAQGENKDGTMTNLAHLFRDMDPDDSEAQGRPQTATTLTGSYEKLNEDSFPAVPVQKAPDFQAGFEHEENKTCLPGPSSHALLPPHSLETENWDSFTVSSSSTCEIADPKPFPLRTSSLPMLSPGQAAFQIPDINIQEPSPRKEHNSKKRPPPLQFAVEPPQTRTRRDAKTGLPILPCIEAERWLEDFPGNTPDLNRLLLHWSLTMCKISDLYADDRAFSLHPGFAFPVARPVFQRLTSVHFYDTSVQPHKEIRFIGPGQLADIIYGEVDTFISLEEEETPDKGKHAAEVKEHVPTPAPQPKSKNHRKQLKKREKAKAAKLALGQQNEAQSQQPEPEPEQQPKDPKGKGKAKDAPLRYVSPESLTATGQGRWAFLVLRAHPTPDEDTDAYMMLAWPVCTATTTSECLFTLYPGEPPVRLARRPTRRWPLHRWRLRRRRRASPQQQQQRCRPRSPALRVAAQLAQGGGAQHAEFPRADAVGERRCAASCSRPSCVRGDCVAGAVAGGVDAEEADAGV
ncbi:hypothetical protein IQ07DRAFT_642080 [Pyrenochaeta sp. DS3sAY3a]|nr:hypothetical protein IQ07DRAFT_642080 [Pyrenochaeta sp. DS3sAY3a]